MSQVIETIELVEQLHKSSLNFPVSTGSLGESLSSDGINLIHKDDAGLVLLGIAEHFSDYSGRLSNVLVNDGRSNYLQELGIDLAGQGSRKQGFASTWRSVQQHSLGRLDSHPLEQLGIGERQLNCFSQVSDLVSESSHVRVLDLAWIFGNHVVHVGVDLSGQNHHDGVSGHVQSDSDSRKQLGLVDLGSHSHHVPGASGSLDHDFLVCELLEHLSYHLADAFDILDVLFSLVKLLFLFLSLEFQVLDSLLNLRIVFLSLQVVSNQGFSVCHFI